jgi:hypothetical protein
MPDMIEDFVLTARNQFINLGGKTLRMCRIPDENGKVNITDERSRSSLRLFTEKNAIERRARRSVRIENCSTL